MGRPLQAQDKNNLIKSIAAILLLAFGSWFVYITKATPAEHPINVVHAQSNESIPEQITPVLQVQEKPVEVIPQVKVKSQATASPNPPAPAKGEIQELMKAKVIAKWGEGEWNSMLYIMQKESGSNPKAINKSSGACGIPQALPCSKLLKVIGTLDNVDGQLDWMVSYIAQRYETPTKAVAFHKKHNWY